MKKLHLRIDLSLYDITLIPIITDFFSQYFKNVTVLDITKQKQEIHNFVKSSPHKVISLDKYIPLDYNIDASRVFDINGNYMYHNYKFSGKMARNEHVVLYDHDAVGGFQLKIITAMLETCGCTVEQKLFIRLNKEEAEEIKQQMAEIAHELTALEEKEIKLTPTKKESKRTCFCRSHKKIR